jgi:hypothetical protein
MGWQMLPPGHRRGWAIAGALAALLSVAYLPWHLDLLQGVHRRIELQGAYYRDLRSAGKAPAVRAAVDRCGRIAAADHRPVPHLRWWLEGDPGSVGTAETATARVLLLPRRTRAMKRFYAKNFPQATAPAGFERIYRNGSWRVLAAPQCR